MSWYIQFHFGWCFVCIFKPITLPGGRSFLMGTHIVTESLIDLAFCKISAF